MKILFIAPSAYLLGGVQDWLFSICMGLRARGHDIVVGVPNNKFHKLAQYNTYFSGLQAKGFVNRSGTAEGRIRALTEFLINNPAEIIVGVNIGDLYEAFRRAKIKLESSKIVLSLHAIEANYFEDIKQYGGLLDAVITTNRLSQAMVESLNVIPSYRVFYAPYGIDVKRIKNSHLPYNTLRLAWIGRIENSQKRVSDIVGILRELDKTEIEYTLSIAGDGPYMVELKNCLSEWVKSKQVKLLGFLNKDDLEILYQSHDVMLITSQWETGPIVAWEAMASGLVVVSSKYIGHYFEKALRHNETALLYNIGDTKDACNQIMRLADNDLRQRIAENGRRLALSRYSTIASLSAWENAFESIMELGQRDWSFDHSERSKKSSGRLESIFGLRLSEKMRSVLPGRGNTSDPGSEWPHSLQEYSNQTHILRYAQDIEDSIK